MLLQMKRSLLVILLDGDHLHLQLGLGSLQHLNLNPDKNKFKNPYRVLYFIYEYRAGTILGEAY
jgi:hypothetical protein